MANSGSKISEPEPTWRTKNTIKVATHSHQTYDGRILANKSSTQDNTAIINLLVTKSRSITI